MKKLIFVLTLIFYSILTPIAFAQTSLKDTGCLFRDTGVVTLSCIPYIFQNIIYWALVFAGIVALVLIIVSGIKFITSGGDAKQAEGARKMLTYAIIGLILILLSFAIIRFIEQTAGLKPGCITTFGFNQCE